MYPSNRQPSTGGQPTDKDSQLSPGPPPPVHERLTTPVFSAPRAVQALHAPRHFSSLLRPDSLQSPSFATMCAPNHNALLTYAGLKVPAPSPYFTLNPAAGQLSALDFHRSQFCDYRQLLGLRQYHALHATGLGPYAAAYLDPYTQYLYKGDPRARFVQEEPKPSHSYIGLIAMAILSSKDKKLVLSDIYQWILDNYPYFRTRGPGWRNSIRHNLSLNDCFIKSGRSANGKGHFWAVHPANVDDFTRGDFRRRRAQRKVRKHMGLSVPDDDDDSPSPSPNPISWGHSSQDAAKDSSDDFDNNNVTADNESERNGVMASVPVAEGSGEIQSHAFMPLAGRGAVVGHVSKKRLFDMDSILAPDYPVVVVPKVRLLTSTASSNTAQSDKDSVTSDHHPVCHSDESDVDIEGEDGDNSHFEEADKSSEQVTEDDHQHQASGQSPPEAVHLSGIENCDAKTEAPSEDPDDHNSQGVQTSTSESSPFSMPPGSGVALSESSSSALDLSSSSLPSSTMNSMSVMSADPAVSSMSMMAAGPMQTLILPRSLDSGQRGRWMGLGMGMGAATMGGSSADLGLRRYSAFHAAGGGSNSGLRGSLTSSVAPFLHPVFAAARYPSLLPLGASTSSASAAAASSESRGCLDDASHDSASDRV